MKPGAFEIPNTAQGSHDVTAVFYMFLVLDHGCVGFFICYMYKVLVRIGPGSMADQLQLLEK